MNLNSNKHGDNNENF